MPHEPKVGELPQTLQWASDLAEANGPDEKVWFAASLLKRLVDEHRNALATEREARKDEAREAARYRALRLEAGDILNLLEGSYDFFGDLGKQLDEACDRAIEAKREHDAALQAEQPESP